MAHYGWLDGTLEVGERVQLVQLRPTLRCVMTAHHQADLVEDLRILHAARAASSPSHRRLDFHCDCRDYTGGRPSRARDIASVRPWREGRCEAYSEEISKSCPHQRSAQQVKTPHVT